MYSYTCTACGDVFHSVRQEKARQEFTEHATVKHRAKVIMISDPEEGENG